jgi:hypothetical protein
MRLMVCSRALWVPKTSSMRCDQRWSDTADDREDRRLLDAGSDPESIPLGDARRQRRWPPADREAR